MKKRYWSHYVKLTGVALIINPLPFHSSDIFISAILILHMQIILSTPALQRGSFYFLCPSTNFYHLPHLLRLELSRSGSKVDRFESRVQKPPWKSVGTKGNLTPPFVFAGCSEMGGGGTGGLQDQMPSLLVFGDGELFRPHLSVILGVIINKKAWNFPWERAAKSFSSALVLNCTLTTLFILRSPTTPVKKEATMSS